MLVNQEVAAQPDPLGRVLEVNTAVISPEQTKIRTTVDPEAVVKAPSGNMPVTGRGSTGI